MQTTTKNMKKKKQTNKCFHKLIVKICKHEKGTLYRRRHRECNYHSQALHYISKEQKTEDRKNIGKTSINVIV